MSKEEPKEFEILSWSTSALQAGKNYRHCPSVIKEALGNKPAHVRFTYTEEQEHLKKINEQAKRIKKLEAVVERQKAALQKVHEGIAELKRPEHVEVKSMRRCLNFWDWGHSVLKETEEMLNEHN